MRNKTLALPIHNIPLGSDVRASIDAIAEALVAGYQDSSVAGLLAARMAERLRRMRWPADDASRHRRLHTCGRELAKIAGTPTNDEAREIIRALAALLQKHNLLDAAPESVFVGNDPRSHRTIAELGQVLDATGTRTLARAQRDIVAALKATPVDLAALARNIAIVLCLSFAASDTIVALAAARWDDIDWEKERLALPKAIIRHGDVIAVSARFVVLSPLILLALAVLRAQQDDEFVFSPATLVGRGDVASWITAQVQQTGLTSSQIHSVASRLAQQYLPGWVVEAAIDDAMPYSPLSDNEPLNALLNARFSADIPVDYGSVDAPTPRTTSIKRIPSPAKESLARFDKLLPKKGQGQRRASRADAAKLIRREAATLLAHVLPTAPAAVTPSLYKAVRAAYKQIDESAESETRWQWAIIANTVCVLLLLAYRLERPSGVTWLERGDTKADKSPRRETPSLVALGTIGALNATLTTSLHAIGQIPLTQWTESEWLTIDYTTEKFSTLRSKITALRQLGDFVRLRIGLRLQLGWPNIPNETFNATISLPRPGQIVGVFTALARIPQYGEDALRLASAMLGFGLREQEAAQLFAREIDGLSCYVAPDATKDGEARRSPRGWLPKIAIEALDQRRRSAAQEAQTAKMEPWLLKDMEHYPSTLGHVRRTLAEWGMHPHLLRHCHITWRQLAQTVYAGEPNSAWPEWMIAAAREKDGLRAAAQGAGHSTSRETRAVYTQLHLWLVACDWQRRDAKVLDTLVSRNNLGIALGLSSTQWRRALGVSQQLATNRSPAGLISLAEAVAAVRTLHH